ncbi:hypothetical protein LK994_04440 [Ferruginibacter lapsinanis]|uniref:hypothetical protein n=1 Tax=Ferruginibacter lapsinanis TaxID=563172 RepID=UPI001E467CEC|nr:hypothetical protein [Ferruginibacter lapsinanis]UEG50721.1 hypothetical protein LK994_04440 [Ferruginibacter lapsinanis]
MEKINSIQELKNKKEQLAQRKIELEKAIKYDWRDVKEAAAPVKIAGQMISKLFSKKEKEEKSTLFADGVSSILSVFAGKMVDKAGAMMGKWFTKTK